MNKQEFIYKIRNKETGQYGGGVSYYWNDSFLNSVMYHSEGAAKATLTKIRKQGEWYEKYFPNSSSFKEYYAFLDKAEIVKVRLEISIES